MEGSGNRSSVNDNTDLDYDPPCELGHVLRDVLLRVLYLGQKHGSGARIVLFRVDVDGAFSTGSSGPRNYPRLRVLGCESRGS